LQHHVTYSHHRLLEAIPEEDVDDDVNGEVGAEEEDEERDRQQVHREDDVIL
jgi:hypothetical protein